MVLSQSLGYLCSLLQKRHLVTRKLIGPTYTETMKLMCTQTEYVLIEKQTDNLFLPWTSIVAASEVSFPTLLFAAHWYSPLSAVFIVVIVNSLLSARKLIRGTLLVNTEPFLVHVIVGTGFPLALQDKVTLLPSVTGPP